MRVRQERGTLLLSFFISLFFCLLCVSVSLWLVLMKGGSM
jgi:hypothetical protein